MSQEQDELDDPELKQAVRRAFGTEPAPPALRRRIESLFAAPAVGGVDVMVRRPRRAFWSVEAPAKTAVAAAIALLAVGFMAMQVRWHLFPPRLPPATPVAITIPDSFALAMVRQHNQCAKHPEQHPAGSKDLSALRQQLAQVDGVAVAALEMGNGWTFRSGGTCEVDGVKTAHLLYQRGNQIASVFSMPAPASCGGRNAYGIYKRMVEEQPMVGILEGGAAYCIVASGPKGELKTKDLEPLLAQVQAEVCVTGCAPGSAAP